MNELVTVPSHLVGYPFKTCQVDLTPDVSVSSFVRNPKGRTVEEKFISNPMVTDCTLREQCELKYLLAQNPDISGLSLVADDRAADERLATVSVEDFLPAKDHYDIFDMAEFIEHAKSQFKKLPVGLRMMYDNNPIKLVEHFDKDQSAALQNMEHFFRPLTADSQSSATPAVGSQGSTGTTNTQTSLETSSSDLSIDKNNNNAK